LTRTLFPSFFNKKSVSEPRRFVCHPSLDSCGRKTIEVIVACHCYLNGVCGGTLLPRRMRCTEVSRAAPPPPPPPAPRPPCHVQGPPGAPRVIILKTRGHVLTAPPPPPPHTHLTFPCLLRFSLRVYFGLESLAAVESKQYLPVLMILDKCCSFDIRRRRKNKN